MFLICYGTRPEMIKLLPLINKFKENNILFETLFSGQHKTLYEDFKDMIPKPDYIFKDIMEHGQSLNKLSSKILLKMDDILINNNITSVIIQGDTTTAYSIALSAFHHNKKIIHLEAGLRTHNKYSPFPEEMNRCLISKLADIHLCPTDIAVKNLELENITQNVYNVGNTIVDIYKHILKNTMPSNRIQEIINNKEYIVVTLHRRENRGDKMSSMWNQLSNLSRKYNFIYITHPSLPNSKNILVNKNIDLLDPVDYESMVYLISKSKGIITDSGGLQEEAVCANKRVLVCRNTTERPETINCGLGKLIDSHITENITFFDDDFIDVIDNPYGSDVCDKIVKIIKSL
tara:strand:+ start:1113 stop:2150 length:1038 start_codon:yes stop_codon:yes gene_type:complete